MPFSANVKPLAGLLENRKHTQGFSWILQLSRFSTQRKNKKCQQNKMVWEPEQDLITFGIYTQTTG
jgi:hypothetical protein